jgi:hypothetical protein
MIREGAKVSYVGDDDDLAVGDRGKVISSAGASTSHVLWATGKRIGQITLVEDADLVSSPKHAAVSYDGLDSGSLVTISVRDTYDSAGEVGLLNALNDEGHLASLSAIAEETVQIVASRLRSDPSMKEVLASLEPEEASEFVTFTASVLLRDAFGGVE